MAAHREPRSLFGEILDWMLVPLLLLWPLSVFVIWLVAQGIANNPYDRELGELARTVSRQVLVAPGPGGRPQAQLRLSDAEIELLRADDQDRVVFQVLGLRGERVAGDRDLPVPEGPPGESLTLYFRDDTMANESMRVAYLWLPVGSGRADDQPPLVQVAETLLKRNRLADEIVKGVVFPQFAILPVAVVLVWFALTRGIAPLSALQQRIRRRPSDDLSPIARQDAPEELVPLVESINDLLSRLQESLTTQKRFLADAAHQLKTPLAGLRMQAELAQREIDAGHPDPQSLKRSLQQIEQSSQRAAHMVNQMLAMARAENAARAVPAQPLQLAALARETVLDFVPRALERRIDLGYEGPSAGELALALRGQPTMVRELVRNLVDNALLYTPAGGTVTVRVLEDAKAGAAVLQVEDNGPGIPAAERERVFEAFYRPLGTAVDGSGLGLAIVREIAQQHGAVVELGNARQGGGAGRPGALFTVRFPGVAAARPAPG